MSIARNFGLSAFGAAIALALTLSGAHAQIGIKAGVAAAVRGPVQQVSYRTPQATVGRNVGSGDEVFLGDRIVTGAEGGLQIMLLDGTTFSLGPNTALVIDTFVFNPADGRGSIAASVARGTLRVVSGRVARQEQEAIRIKLPVATVGIRGSMLVLAGDPNGFFIGLFGVGADNSGDRPPSLLTVGVNGTQYEIFRTGFGCTVTPGSPVCAPALITPDFVQQILSQVGGNARQTTVSQFNRLTGLDLVTALQLAKTQGLADYSDLLSKLFQDQHRPQDFTPSTFGSSSPPPPPPPPPPPDPCANGEKIGARPQLADAAGKTPLPPRVGKGRQRAATCF